MTFSKNKKISPALILAAGFGKRLMPITKNIPKAMVEVQGIKMIDRVIDQIKNCGIKNIFVNTHYLAPLLHQHLAKRNDVQITISHEPEILETGGGVLKVMSENNLSTLLVVNSDNLMPQNKNAIDLVLQNWNPEKMDFLVALKNKNDAKTYQGCGDYSLDNHSRLSLSDPKNFIFVGAYIIKSNLLDGFKPGNFRLPEVLNSEINKNKNHKIYAIEYKGQWFDIGSPQNLEFANKHFEN